MSKLELNANDDPDYIFWRRLRDFISDVQTGCMMGEEEKIYILGWCKYKLDEYEED